MKVRYLLLMAILATFSIQPAEARHHRQHITYDNGSVIGGRPAGCPSAFCGCGASLYLFHKIIPSLNLAANWLRFPRAAPAPGMAAARSGHVMALVEHRHGDVWLVHDSNSGGHLTRLHERSIAGYAVVNPNGGEIRVARAARQPSLRFSTQPEPPHKGHAGTSYVKLDLDEGLRVRHSRRASTPKMEFTPLLNISALQG